MKINWRVRLKNKTFWVTAIPTLALLIANILKVFGIDVKLGIDFGSMTDKTQEILFALLTIMTSIGVVTDHTTEGFGDSEQALTYDIPKEDTFLEEVDESEEEVG